MHVRTICHMWSQRRNDDATYDMIMSCVACVQNVRACAEPLSCICVAFFLHSRVVSARTHTKIAHNLLCEWCGWWFIKQKERTQHTQSYTCNKKKTAQTWLGEKKTQRARDLRRVFVRQVSTTQQQSRRARKRADARGATDLETQTKI